MTEQPGNAELDRLLREGFATVNARLDKLVSQDVFLAEQRRVDERHAALQADIAEEKAERIAAIRDERAERVAADTAEQNAREAAITKEKGEREKIGVWVRWVAASIAIPVVLFFANVVNDLGKP
jgi:regulator of protease activity HflC (stomatin/prohibitin superfamily)